MLQVLVQCTELSHIAYDCYTYPTSLIRLPFGKKMPSVQEIAHGLKSFIEGHYPEKKHIILVAHSLGGLISRHFILESLKSKHEHRIAGLILYASPLSGSGWAFASKFSWKHAHLQQLKFKSDFLSGMNNDWIMMQVETKIKTFHVVAGIDAIVSPESTLPYIGQKNNATIIGEGHINITKPTSLEDLRFVYLKNFLVNTLRKNENIATPTKPQLDTANTCNDVLFDFYTNSVERFYHERKEDSVSATAAQSSNLWISGPPGIGKTAVLRRLTLMSGWTLQHVILDSYRDLSALELMREICNLLLDRCGIETILPKDSTQQTVLNEFRKAICRLLSNKPLAILIEEIPLSSGHEYSKFLNLCYQLTLLTESLNDQSRVIWLYSSICNPKFDIKSGHPKIYEKIQFIEFDPWHSDDIKSLIDLITKTLPIQVSDEDLRMIVQDSKGIPRYVKMLFRRARNEVGSQKEFSEISSSVQQDLAL